MTQATHTVLSSGNNIDDITRLTIEPVKIYHMRYLNDGVFFKIEK